MGIHYFQKKTHHLAVNSWYILISPAWKKLTSEALICNIKDTPLIKMWKPFTGTQITARLPGMLIHYTVIVDSWPLLIIQHKLPFFFLKEKNGMCEAGNLLNHNP